MLYGPMGPLLRALMLLLVLPFLAAGNCGETPDACEVDPDRDGDGHDDLHCGDGDDCDDTDGARFPGNPEVCDFAAHDEDCDETTFGNRDADGDDAADARCCNATDSGDLLCGDDCDDERAGIHPGSSEVCDDIDTDCDGAVDEGVLLDLYDDDDSDGHGAGDPDSGCFLRPGLSYLGNDCDDSNPAIVPGAMECTGAQTYRICGEDGAWTEPAACASQGACQPQPNDTGVCLAQPPPA